MSSRSGSPSRGQLGKEEEEHRFMLLPDGRVRMTWDFCVVLPCLFFLGLTTPFFACFAFDPRRSHHPTLLAFEAFVDSLFVVDILLNFRTGVLIPATGLIELDPGEVAKHYVCSWLPIDVVSAIPFSLLDLLLVSSATGGAPWLGTLKVLKAGRTVKALRVFRFLKLSKILKTAEVFHLYMDRYTKDYLLDLQYQYGSTIPAKFVQVVLMLTLLCHYFACLWVMMGRTGSKHGHVNWLETTLEDVTYKDTKHGPRVGSIYLASFYYCMTTMTSVGYGDISPTNDKERLFGIALEGMGCVMYALIVATLTSVIMTKDANQRAMSEKLGNISSYVAHRGFSPQLARRLRLYFRHFYGQRMAIDEQQILNDLSTSLRQEVSSFLVSELMEQVSFFRSLSSTYWSSMLPLLRPCLFTVDEVVCTEGEDTADMYVVLVGECIATTTGRTVSHHITTRGGEQDGTTAAPLPMLSSSSSSWSPSPSASSPPSHLAAPLGINGSEKGSTTAATRAAASAGGAGEEGGGGDRFGSSSSSPHSPRIMRESSFDLGQTRFTFSRRQSSSNHSTASNGNTRRRSASGSRLLGNSLELNLTEDTTTAHNRKDGSNSTLLSGCGVGCGGPQASSSSSSKGLGSKPVTPTSSGKQWRSLSDNLSNKMRRAATTQAFLAPFGGKRVRQVRPGDTVNALCALGVWPKCVETVVSSEICEGYSVSAAAFQAMFKGDEALLEAMQVRTTMTAFAMVPDPAAPTEWGMPIYQLSAKEVAQREAKFQSKIQVQQKKRRSRLQQVIEEHERRASGTFRPRDVRTLSSSGKDDEKSSDKGAHSATATPGGGGGAHSRAVVFAPGSGGSFNTSDAGGAALMASFNNPNTASPPKPPARAMGRFELPPPSSSSTEEKLGGGP